MRLFSSRGVCRLNSESRVMNEKILEFVSGRFGDAHSATPCLDYPYWKAVATPGAQPAAALGYRDAALGPLFLEAYLAAPVEEIISRALGCDVERSMIVEIGCLAALPSPALVKLWCETAQALSTTHRVAVATLTRPLRAMLVRVGLPLVWLADAHPELLGTGAADWGTYYDLDPVIYAGDISQGAEALARFGGKAGRK